MSAVGEWQPFYITYAGSWSRRHTTVCMPFPRPNFSQSLFPTPCILSPGSLLGSSTQSNAKHAPDTSRSSSSIQSGPNDRTRPSGKKQDKMDSRTSKMHIGAPEFKFAFECTNTPLDFDHQRRNAVKIMMCFAVYPTSPTTWNPKPLTHSLRETGACWNSIKFWNAWRDSWQWNDRAFWCFTECWQEKSQVGLFGVRWGFLVSGGAFWC